MKVQLLYLHAWGSPTILVDELEVGGELRPVRAGSRRLYADVRGVPSDDQICALLRAWSMARRSMPTSTR